MSAETVPVQSNNDEVDEPEVQFQTPVDEGADTNEAQAPVQAPPKEEHVPLSALQKERRKRQEIEQELRWHKDQMMRQSAPQAAQEPDESLQEPATREDLGKFRQDFKKEVKREVFESEWIKNNPDRVAEINDKLPEFLKQRPHLAAAIEGAPNRYEEAWLLMDALTPKQKAALRPAPVQKKEAPGNPGSVPKAAAMNQSVDVMSMSDSEFNAWRQSQRKRR